MNLESMAHDLFLLMLNLSQLKDTGRILAIFLEALNREQSAVSLRLLAEGEPAPAEAIQIATAQNTFGWVVIEGDTTSQPPDFFSLIRNAVRMLAIILENRAQEKLLADERRQLENAVKARASELLQTNAALQLEIEERKRAENALREKTEELDHYFTLSLDLLCIADTEGFFHRLNPEWERTLGYTLSELEGKRFLDFVHPDDVKATIEAVSQLQQQQMILNFVNRYRCKDGSYRWVEWRSFPSGKLIYAVARDITERKRTEEALRRSEALYRQAIELLDAVPYYQTYHPNTYTFMGEGIRQLTGYGPDEITPELWRSLVQDSILFGEVSGLERDEASKLARRGQFGTWKSDDCIRTRDGQLRWVVVSAVEISDDQGVPYASLGILQDVTWRKQAEEALRVSNRRLEETLAALRKTQEQMVHRERLAAVGQLAAGIAHDFNNMLASVALYTQMSLRSTSIPPKVRQHLEIITKQVDLAADLIQQILDFGQQSVLERQPLAMDTFLDDMIKLLQRTLPENIQIALVYDSDDYMIQADQVRMQQVIVNLALNARDAMSQGGDLHIELSRCADQEIVCIECGRIPEGTWIEIAITDTGAGIPPDVLPHIFEPFFTTRAPLGHGLGLSQVLGIVKQHGGHLNVHTEVGTGTTFRLYFPALPVGQPRAGDTTPVTVHYGQGERILVVEDDVTMQAALADALDMLGYRVLKAANGKEALAICEQYAIDSGEGAQRDIALVLSDWVMPVMGGQELMHALKAYNPALRVLLLTGYPLDKEMKDNVASNVVGWMLKPPSLEELAEGIARALSLA